MTKEKQKMLKKLWLKKTNYEICRLLDISIGTLYAWKSKLELPNKPSGHKKYK